MTLVSGTMMCFINGVIPRSGVSCPTLDPTASIQITDGLISVYQSRIDAVINQLGKNVLLNFDPERADCPNCSFDMIRGRSRNIYTPGGPRPFARGRQCPYCKGVGFLKTPVQQCIRCLIRWNPKDAVDYGISITRGTNIVRFKTYLYNYPYLVRSIFAISNYASQNIVNLKVRRIKDPIITGLRDDRYCISFWETV